MPAGKVSATVVAPLVAAPPRLVTTSVQVPFWPTVKPAVCRLSSASSGALATEVGSESASLAGSGSPAAATVAELVTAGSAAGATAVTSVKVALSPAAIAPANVAV